MKPKDHVILFYTNQRDKHLILFTYLKAGLDEHEAAIYVAAEETSASIREAMKRFGINVEYYERIRALKIVDYSDWYIIRGEFNIDRTMTLWEKAMLEAKRNGFKGLRVAGETSCFFKYNMIHQLIEYERSLHRELKVPMTAICAYDDTVVIRGAEEEQYLRLYWDLITAHGTILFSGPEEKGVIKVV